MPTVVPGPKKSPRAPAGWSNWFTLVRGAVCEHVLFVHTLVMFPYWLAGIKGLLVPGIVNAAMLVT